MANILKMICNSQASKIKYINNQETAIHSDIGYTSIQYKHSIVATYIVKQKLMTISMQETFNCLF